MTTEDGYEQQFALNVLAGFLLTHRLLPLLRKANGRVIFTSSESHRRMDVRWDDVMLSHFYNPLAAYKQSKLCDLLIARGLNDNFARWGVRGYAVDPGLVHTDIGSKDAGGLVDLIWKFRKRGGVFAGGPGGDVRVSLHGERAATRPVLPATDGQNAEPVRHGGGRCTPLRARKPALRHHLRGEGRKMNVLITGAAGGLGRAMAVECGKRGYDLFLTDMYEAALRRVQTGLERRFGVTAAVKACDLTKPESVDELLAVFDENVLRFDMLLNIAGLDYEGAFLSREREAVCRIVSLNDAGTLRITHAVA